MDLNLTEILGQGLEITIFTIIYILIVGLLSERKGWDNSICRKKAWNILGGSGILKAVDFTQV